MVSQGEKERVTVRPGPDLAREARTPISVIITEPGPEAVPSGVPALFAGLAKVSGVPGVVPKRSCGLAMPAARVSVNINAT